MSAVKTAVTPAPETKTNRTFVGRAWVNIKKDAEGKAISSFINISIDKSVSLVELKPGMKIQLWPNKKREGKQDADLRLSIVEAVA